MHSRPPSTHTHIHPHVRPSDRAPIHPSIHQGSLDCNPTGNPLPHCTAHGGMNVRSTRPYLVHTANSKKSKCLSVNDEERASHRPLCVCARMRDGGMMVQSELITDETARLVCHTQLCHTTSLPSPPLPSLPCAKGLPTMVWSGVRMCGGCLVCASGHVVSTCM